MKFEKCKQNNNNNIGCYSAFLHLRAYPIIYAVQSTIDHTQLASCMFVTIKDSAEHKFYSLNALPAETVTCSSPELKLCSTFSGAPTLTTGTPLCQDQWCMPDHWDADS